MTIERFENIIKKFNPQKIEEFSELKFYLSNFKNYDYNFCVYTATEGQIENDDFYAAYVFDEHKLTNRMVLVSGNSGWTTTIIFISSKDYLNIDNWFLCESNSLTRSEMNSFLKEIELIEK